MKKERDYTRDLAEIRSMMERSSKFLSLSGWAGILAGIYALSGAYIAYSVLGFHPDRIAYDLAITAEGSPTLTKLIILALIILTLAVGTAIVLSYRKAKKRGEGVWNASSRLLLTHMAVPLVSGGVFILILMAKGLIGLIAPAMLLFYGLALYSASPFTYDDLKYLGWVQVLLGLISTFFVSYSLFLWALGFGLAHIVYGVYMHLKYERA